MPRTVYVDAGEHEQEQELGKMPEEIAEKIRRDRMSGKRQRKKKNKDKV